MFLLFSFFCARFDVHPPENPYGNIPPSWQEDLITEDSPSRCGGLNIYSAHRLHYEKRKQPYRIDTTEMEQYLRYVCSGYDPFEDFPQTDNVRHYKRNLYRETAFYSSSQVIDVNDFENDNSFESNLFKSIGFELENVIHNQKTEKYINGSKCIIYDIETNNILSRFYFFKRRRYTMLYSYWSENKTYFKQRIPEEDSIVNTISINSY